MTQYIPLEYRFFVLTPPVKRRKIALWLCLGTLCRIGELLMTEWKHLNLEQRTFYSGRKYQR